jgi:hypothetical protein
MIAREAAAGLDTDPFCPEASGGAPPFANFHPFPHEIRWAVALAIGGVGG